MFCNIYSAQDYLALLWPTNSLPNSKAKTQQFWQDLILESFSFFWQVFLPNGILLYLSWNLLSKSCDSPLNKQLFRTATLAFGAPSAALTSCVLWELSVPLKVSLAWFIKTSESKEEWLIIVKAWSK